MSRIFLRGETVVQLPYVPGVLASHRVDVKGAEGDGQGARGGQQEEVAGLAQGIPYTYLVFFQFLKIFYTWKSTKASCVLKTSKQEGVPFSIAVELGK